MDTDGIPAVLCCVCGTTMQANPANMCVGCLQSHVDITDVVSKEATVQFCKFCERYLQPPKYWVQAALESKELLTLCLKRIKGLQKLHLVDACFLWTEPHSKRLKVKVTVQKELFAGTIIQQNAVVEFIVMGQMCETCTKEQAGQEVWKAKVQARQRVDHKKTFFFLEQLILKNEMHRQCTNVKEVGDGVDFYYEHKGHAHSMIDFLNSVAPIKWVQSEELISHDSKSNVANIHYCFPVDIPSICKDDLVCLPLKTSQSMGGLGPIVLCMKVNAGLVFMDPRTLKVGTIPGSLYWKNAFHSLAPVKQATEMYVMDIECEWNAPTNGKYALAEITVCKASEVGRGKQYVCKTHLGNQLEPGDYCLGYILTQLNYNSDAIPQHKRLDLPDVVVVRKHWPQQQRRRHKRRWEVREIPKEVQLRHGEMEKRALDKEEFLDELERDPEYRKDVVLHKRKERDVASEYTDGDDDAPRVDMDEIYDSDEDEDAEDGEAEEGDAEEGDADEGDMKD